MASISNVPPKTNPPRGDADLFGPLAVSLVGLLTHCAAPLAAFLLVGNADEPIR